MSSSSCHEGLFSCLPPELLVKIFCHLNAEELLFTASRVNYRWRKVIQANLKSLPLVPVHCRVDVMDMDPNEDSRDGTHPMIQYSFSVFDPSKPDYKNKLKCCLRANGTWPQLYLNHRVGHMDCEWESTQENPRPTRADPDVIITLLKYMKVEAIRFDVRKSGRRTTARNTDEKFAHAMDFCSRICTKVELKSLLLSSHNTNFPWCFGPLSLKKLASLNVKNLILENMTSPDCFGGIKGMDFVDLSKVRYLHLKLDPSHRQDLDNIFWVDVNGSVLSRLLASHQKCFELRVYSECPQVISMITAEDIVNFTQSWRNLLAPWIIRGLHFNSTFTISEFRAVAIKSHLMGERGVLQDFPYCRFRTYHPADPNAVLELTCYGSGVSTQWQIRSGYSR